MTTTEIRPDEASAAAKTAGTAKGAKAAKAAKTGKGGKDAKKGGKSKKKLIIMIVAVLAIAGGVYKFVLAPTPPPGPPVGGEIVQLDPETVNLTNSHYLQIAVAIQLVQGKATAATFLGSNAEQLIIDDFSNRSVPSLSSNSMRKTLSKQLEKQINVAYPGEVFTIFLTKFVMQ